MMGSESVRSSPAAPQPESPYREDALHSQNTPDRGVDQRRPCFFCMEEGHCFKDCPWRTKASPGTASPAAGAADGVGYPELQCPCGRGACIVRTSRTERNPGRDFYTCPFKPISEKCNFFLWCDKVVSDPLRGANSPVKSYQQRGDNSPVKLDQRHGFNSPMQPEKRYAVDSPVKLDRRYGVTSPVKPEQQFDVNSPVKPEQQFGVNSSVNPNKQHCNTNEPLYPMCACGAGRCRLLTMQDGDDAGRKYFACTIKKGQGACNFFRWHDTANKPPEMKNENLGCNESPSFNLVPEEAKHHETDGADEANVCGSDPVPDSKDHEEEDGGPGEAKDDSTPEGLPSDVPVVPSSPSPSSSKDQASSSVGVEFLPIERLSLHEVGPSPFAFRPGKCFRCGKEGHWMNECATANICFKCGKFGHWRKDCTM